MRICIRNGQEQEKKFKETADYNRYMKEQRWYDDVTSKRTGEYYQANELIEETWYQRRWSPPHIDENQKPLEYPLKYVTGIYRVRTADMSEWLMRLRPGGVLMYLVMP